MREVVRRTLSISAVLLLISAAPAFAGGGDPDDRPQNMNATGGSGANSPGAAPSGAWDVNDPPGPHHDAKLDTHTGTWMSVDVSPDGKEIVFDLLGDIYTIPDRGRRGEGAHARHGVGRAAALQPGRQAHRVHQRSRRRRQHLGHGPRRLAARAGHARRRSGC